MRGAAVEFMRSTSPVTRDISPSAGTRAHRYTGSSGKKGGRGRKEEEEEEEEEKEGMSLY